MHEPGEASPNVYAYVDGAAYVDVDPDGLNAATMVVMSIDPLLGGACTTLGTAATAAAPVVIPVVVAAVVVKTHVESGAPAMLSPHMMDYGYTSENYTNGVPNAYSDWVRSIRPPGPRMEARVQGKQSGGAQKAPSKKLESTTYQLRKTSKVEESSRKKQNNATAAPKQQQASKPQKGLRRPYLRKETRKQIEADAPRTADGRPIDPNTRKPIDGKPDIGHKTGHEHRTEKAKAESEGLSQKEFNDRMNDPSKYQLEDPSSNRSHRYEQK